MRHLIVALLVASAPPVFSATPEPAALAINALGLDLHRQLPKEGNLCLSPYSIQNALAMTYLGASGATQEEMARVLHFSKDKQAQAESFAALNQALAEAVSDSVKRVAEAKKYGGPSEPLTLRVANRLFGQKSYEFRQPFLTGVKQYFGAPLLPIAFDKDPSGATHEINNWVAEQTQNRIRDLIPQNALGKDTRLVLTNALYFKAAWADDFNTRATSSKPFHVNGSNQTADVPTMAQDAHLRYLKGMDFQAVTLPYVGRQLHLLLIVPDSIDGLSRIEETLTPGQLLSCSRAEQRQVILHLPKFKITPPAAELGELLKKLGMTTSFDEPKGSADFDALAAKKPDDYLYISKVLHKTFLEIDEKGTEAAAATAVVVAMAAGIPAEKPKPIVLKADRPFLFAIQHAETGACLFLGRVTDPR